MRAVRLEPWRNIPHNRGALFLDYDLYFWLCLAVLLFEKKRTD
jgi:hypothetical protein